MARMNKQQKLQRNIDRLAAEFGVTTVTISIGSAGYMTNGLYSRNRTVYTYPGGPGSKPVPAVSPEPRITIDHKLTWATLLETMAHEFAHHLAYEWGLDCVREHAHSRLFWLILEQVRMAILPGIKGATTLEYNIVDQIDKSWR